MKRETVYREALHTFGRQTQMTVAIEELSELQKEICKFLRGTVAREHLVEEMADVYIMLEQLQYILAIHPDEIETVMRAKVDRLASRIAEAQKAFRKCGEDFEW